MGTFVAPRLLFALFVSLLLPVIVVAVPSIPGVASVTG